MDERELNMDVVTPQDSQDTDEPESQPRSRHIPREVASKLLEDARGRCCLCRLLIDPQRLDDDALFGSLEKHHIVYFSEGGGNTYDNLLLVCANCHTQVHKRPEKYPIEELRQKKQHWVGMKKVVPSELRVDDDVQDTIQVTFSIESLNLEYSIAAPPQTTVSELALFVRDKILKPLGAYDNNGRWVHLRKVALALRSAPDKPIGSRLPLKEVQLLPGDTLVAIIRVPLVPKIIPGWRDFDKRTRKAVPSWVWGVGAAALLILTTVLTFRVIPGQWPWEPTPAPLHTHIAASTGLAHPAGDLASSSPWAAQTPMATRTPTPTKTLKPTDTPLPTKPTNTPRPTVTPRPPGVVDAHMGGNVSIQGIVKDTSGNVAPDVLVGLGAYWEGGSFGNRLIGSWGVYTDETGSYSFRNLPEVDGGYYELHFAGDHQYGRVYENSIYRISEDRVSGDFHLTTGITDFRVITNEDETGGTLCVLNVTLYPVTGSTLHALVQYEDADGTTKSLYSSRCHPNYFIGLNRGTGPDNHVYSAAGCQYVQLRDGMGIYEGLAGGIYYMNFDYVRSDGVEVHGAIPPFEIPPGETKLLEYTIPLNP